MRFYMILFCLVVIVVLPAIETSTNNDEQKRGSSDSGTTTEKEDPVKRSISFNSNWKECSWTNINNNQDSGLITECVFQKKYTESILHVYWNGDFRIAHCVDCCSRWFFTFNGVECQKPRQIDGNLVMGQLGRHKGIHRVRHIEGHCDKIHNGQVRVGFNVGRCTYGSRADASTGWKSNSRLFIEEVPRPQE